jgi:hypothetical protein
MPDRALVATVTLLGEWTFALAGCGPRSVTSEAATRVDVRPVASSAASVAALERPPDDAGVAEAAAASPFTGAWMKEPAAPGEGPLDAHFFWTDGRWQWRATSHRGCDAGVIARAGRWALSGATLEFEEDVVATLVVTDPRVYAVYQACLGYWDGRKCDWSQPRSVHDCSLSGVVERIEEHSPPLTMRTWTAACVPPGPKNRECRELAGVRYWRIGKGDDPGSYFSDQEAIVYDETAHRWRHPPAP